MTYKTKPFAGALFKNKDKKENQPDWKGRVMLEDGNELWVSGWEKVPQTGDVYISLALQPKAQDNK